MQGKDLATEPISETQDQQAFIDERAEAVEEPPSKKKNRYWLKRESVDDEMPELEESDGEMIAEMLANHLRKQVLPVRGIFRQDHKNYGRHRLSRHVDHLSRRAAQESEKLRRWQHR